MANSLREMGRCRLRTWLPASGAGTGMDLIRGDDAGQQRNQYVALVRGKRLEDSRFGGPADRKQVLPQLRSALRKSQQACATVLSVHAAIDESGFLKKIDDLAGARTVDAEPRGKAVLIDIWMEVQVSKHGILQRRKARFGER